MRKAQSKTGIVLKVVLGAAVFAWMASTGKISLAQVVLSFAHWPLMLAIAAVGYIQVGVCAYRWRLLLKAQEVPLPAGQAWGLTMIGMLFNVVLPGSVGGDLAKGYYIARAAPGRESRAVTAMLLDRITGFVGLFALATAAVIANWGEIARSASARGLAAISACGVLGGVVVLYAAVLAGGRLATLKFLPGVLRSAFQACHEYRNRSAVIPVAIVLSVLNQSLTCAMYYLALRAAAVERIPLSQFFLVVPLGLAATAIPIAPAGIGVGQAAFFGLFKIVAPRFASRGADAFTVYQMVFILLCLTGAYWYITYRRSETAVGRQPDDGQEPRTTEK